MIAMNQKACKMNYGCNSTNKTKLMQVVVEWQNHKRTKLLY